MKRRTLLKAAPAGLAALAVGGAAEAATETPVMALFREWQAFTSYINGDETRGISEDEMSDLTDLKCEMEDALLAVPSASPADFIAKIIAYTNHGEGGLPDHYEFPDLWAEARALVA